MNTVQNNQTDDSPTQFLSQEDFLSFSFSCGCCQIIVLWGIFSLTGVCAEGVTFLALGNGAPDVFSAMAAFSHPHTAGLAVGALFGRHSLSHTHKHTSSFLKWKPAWSLSPSLCTQELVYLSLQWSRAAWHWSSLSLWLPVLFCGTSSSTWRQCFGRSSCCTKEPQHWEKYWVLTHTHTLCVYTPLKKQKEQI